MTESKSTKTLLAVIAGCLLVNTVTFALPAAYKAIRNEIAWIESERQRRIAEREEAERSNQASEMCTKERITLYNKAFQGKGKLVPEVITKKIDALPNAERGDAIVSRGLYLGIATQYHHRNPVNVNLPLTIEECLATWPRFPTHERLDAPINVSDFMEKYTRERTPPPSQ